jgi:TonB family protein
MSGGSQRAYFSLSRPARLAGFLAPTERRKRLAAALVLSFLLHALVAVMPSPGTGARADRAAPRALEVRLERGETPGAPVAGADSAWTAVPPVPAPPPVEPPGPAARLSRGLDVLPVPAAPYFTTERLTKQPIAASQPSLAVPRQTARYVTGRVLLRIWINELGGVEEVEVERSDLPKTIAALAAEAFRKLHFVPGEIDGRPVGVLMRIEVAYVDGRVAYP